MKTYLSNQEGAGTSPKFQEIMYFFIPLNDIALGIEERSKAGHINVVEILVERPYRNMSGGLQR